MLHLLMRPRTVRTVRGLIGTLADAARSIVSPAALVADHTEPAVAEAADPAGLYEPDEIPATETIEAAAREYERAADQARRADRGKRAAKKVLDKLPAGIYGTWRVFRTPSSRQTPDLAAITATYKRLGLGPVPMKPCAPSLKVELVEVAPVGTEVLAGVAA
ncbi:hypothetical protein NFX46_26755 [Streptomyces phaeoluteigriseus]|uniref:Uncharacterized protein n=1 Tax=Streptomyces phaeoluteigriseus TaxID=114686 RepID=A0ABY4ZE41_9ACTN|nr:hypothetical protein [Streptomyces phaeoluteigriseus]USQ87000.1 hypothetical protein NFX46_26755 [Streptomyces phaeoluteigriseus]